MITIKPKELTYLLEVVKNKNTRPSPYSTQIVQSVSDFPVVLREYPCVTHQWRHFPQV